MIKILRDETSIGTMCLSTYHYKYKEAYVMMINCAESQPYSSLSLRNTVLRWVIKSRDSFYCSFMYCRVIAKRVQLHPLVFEKASFAPINFGSFCLACERFVTIIWVITFFAPLILKLQQ